MQKLIFIAGGIGSGKSVVAREVFYQLDNVAVVPSDELFIAKPLSFETGLINVKIKNSVALIESYLTLAYHVVICEGLMWDQAVLTLMDDQFGSRQNIQTYLCYLDTPRNVRYARVLKRGRDRADTYEFLESAEKRLPDPRPFQSLHITTFNIVTTDKTPTAIAKELIALAEI